MQIEERVLLLAIYKKKENENLTDIISILEDAGVFSFKDGKKLLKSLKNDGYIEENSLSLIGLEKAKEIEQEFKL